MNYKLFWKVYVIDLIFMGLFIGLGRWFIGKIYGIIVAMQAIGDLLTGYEGLSQESITTDQAIELNSLVNQMSGDLTSLITYLLAFSAVMGLIYVITKSVQWNLIFNGKFKGYKKYLGRFTLFSLIFGVFLVPLFYLILIKSRDFLLPYLFGGEANYGELLFIIITGLIFMFLMYLMFRGYYYSNKYKFKEAFVKVFRFDKLFFVLILTYLISGLLIKYGLALNASIFSMIIIGALVSFVFTWYKFYFVEKLK